MKNADGKDVNVLNVFESMVVVVYSGVVLCMGAAALLGTVLKWFKWAWGY